MIITAPAGLSGWTLASISLSVCAMVVVALIFRARPWREAAPRSWPPLRIAAVVLAVGFFVVTLLK